MRWFVLVVSLFLFPLFSGCASTPPQDPPVSDEDPVLHTAPDDDANISAAAARNRSHVHDYWDGRHELQVIDGTFRMLCTLCGDGVPAVRYEAESGSVIPLGTRWVNITFTWTTEPDSAYSEPHLWLETAADHAPWDAGPIESGGTVQIEVNNTQNDLPHEVLSNWAFELRMAPATPATNAYRINGEGTLVVEAARGHQIPVFPPHPDLWNGTTESLLFEIDNGTDTVYRGAPDGSRTGIQFLGPYGPDNGTTVPYDMDHLTVVIEYDSDAPTPFTLAFHGADTREWTDLEPDEGDGYSYTIPRSDGRPDGPYAVQSQWEFAVFTDDHPSQVFTGGFTIRATAHLDPA